MDNSRNILRRRGAATPGSSPETPARIGTTVLAPKRSGLQTILAGTGVLAHATGIITLCTAVGLLVVALGNYSALRGLSYAETFFWCGLALIVAPTVARMATVDISRNERILMLVEFGLALYLVKVLHSPTS